MSEMPRDYDDWKLRTPEEEFGWDDEDYEICEECGYPIDECECERRWQPLKENS